VKPGLNTRSLAKNTRSLAKYKVTGKKLARYMSVNFWTVFNVKISIK
jgi:hypothetical protein